MTYTIKFTSILIFFFLLAFYLIFFAIQIEDKVQQGKDIQASIKGRNENKSVFIGVNYFYNKNGNKYIDVVSDRVVTGNSDGSMSFVNPVGTFYTSKGQAIKYNAGHGKYWDKIGKIYFINRVKINSPDFNFYANEVIYNSAKNNFLGKGDVRSFSKSRKTGDTINIDSEKVDVRYGQGEVFYKEKVSGEIKRRRKYESGIKFASDELSFYKNQQLITLNGSVKLNKDKIEMNALSGEIFMDNYNKKLKYYSLFDDVRIIEEVRLKNGKNIVRKAYAEKLEGIMGEKMIVLSGNPKVLQGDEYVKGNTIILRENNDVVEVDESTSRLIIEQKK